MFNCVLVENCQILFAKREKSRIKSAAKKKEKRKWRHVLS